MIGLITYGDGVVGLIIAKIPAKYPSLDPIVTGRLESGLPAPKKKSAAAREVVVAARRARGGGQHSEEMGGAD